MCGTPKRDLDVPKLPGSQVANVRLEFSRDPKSYLPFAGDSIPLRCDDDIDPALVAVCEQSLPLRSVPRRKFGQKRGL